MVSASTHFELEKLGQLLSGADLKNLAGNPPPRITETPAGMLNAIGLQNPRLEAFWRRSSPSQNNAAVIVSIAGDTERITSRWHGLSNQRHSGART